MGKSVKWYIGKMQNGRRGGAGIVKKWYKSRAGNWESRAPIYDTYSVVSCASEVGISKIRIVNGITGTHGVM